MISFSCPLCGGRISCPESDAGLGIPCPHCGKSIGVPPLPAYSPPLRSPSVRVYFGGNDSWLDSIEPFWVMVMGFGLMFVLLYLNKYLASSGIYKALGLNSY